MASQQSRKPKGGRLGLEPKPATFYLGVGLYAVSFLLPAVDWAMPMRGWMCACMSLIAWPHEHLWLCLFGGLINPLILFYVILRFLDGAPRLRTTLAIAVLACVPLAWLSLSDLGAVMRIGHVFWVVGIFLTLSPSRIPWPAIEDARWLAVPTLLLLSWWALKLTTIPRLQPLTEQDSFFYQVAMQFKEPSLCEKISRYAEGSGFGGYPGYEISYLQSQCFYNLAGALHDPSLCDKERPISRGIRDGSKYSPGWCRVSPGSAAPIIGPHVGEWMRRLGYRDEDIQHALHRGAFNSPTSAAYDRLKQEPEFQKKIEAAPNFEDPSADDVNRLANDLEYVYQMFAVDTDDPPVCGKISRRAVAINGGFPVPLRLACYSAIAIDGRKLNDCSVLPSRSELRYWENPQYSREECLRVIPLLGAPGGAKSGPVYPSTYESLQRGLHDLGYDVPFPAPTAGDYLAFLRYLENRDPAGRAEFLRRVAALK